MILTTDEDTILCAEKFGDVYSLPLLEESSKDSLNAVSDTNSKLVNVKEQRRFVPAASSLTVHTKRNQQALENQQRVSNKVSEKKVHDFNHQLILGHVSLLIDLAYVTLKLRELGSEHKRDYILTADRDEHIRVSRGLHQAHIIEGYCLGHTEFVSKLCAPPWSPETLISGGGDNFLLVWDWVRGKVTQKVDLRTIVDAFKKENPEDPMIRETSKPLAEIDSRLASSSNRIAVSGIFALSSLKIVAAGALGHLIIICEGKA